MEVKAEKMKESLSAVMRYHKRKQVHMKKRTIGIILAIIIATSFLSGCGERTEENGAEGIYESETESGQTDRQTEISTEAEEVSQEVNSNGTEEITSTMENESGEDAAESVEPYVDEELYLCIKEVFDEIDWDVQYLLGDESKYDLYREQFIKLLKEEISVVDDRGYETTLSQFGEIQFDTNYPDYDPNHYNYYFYDVDGDGTPELGMTNNQRFVYIFKYEETTDKVVMWDVYYYGMAIMGTGKFHWWARNQHGLKGLDQNGDYIYLARFKADGGRKYENAGDDGYDGWAYFVALPNYVELEEWMLEQATYKDDPYEANYFFRVTKEQFDELDERFDEAFYESQRKKEDVTYTYEELLNLK